MENSFNKPESLPYHAQWDITFGCNFRCTFCLTASGKREPNELSTSEAEALIDRLYEQGIWFLKIMGGEPFFRKDIIHIFKYAVQKGMILSFSTNASLINEQRASDLTELRNSILYIQMSLYGENSETYEKVTGSALNFERALKGLKLLVKKDLDVTILTVATEDNAGRIPAYYDIARESGVKEFRLTVEIPLGRSARKANNEMPRLPEIWNSLLKSLNKIKNSMNSSDPPLYLDARPLLGVILHRLTGFQSFYENCSAATTMLYINPSGESLPCPFIRHLPSGLSSHYKHLVSKNILKNSFEDVWESESFKNVRSYYDPKFNLFKINEKCRYFKDGTCIPCALTPCNCMDLIRLIKKQITIDDIMLNEIAEQEAFPFKSC